MERNHSDFAGNEVRESVGRIRKGSPAKLDFGVSIEFQIGNNMTVVSQ
jgi:hypothetical protein